MVEPTEVDAAILAYYASGREKTRLATSCRLEFVRTQELHQAGRTGADRSARGRYLDGRPRLSRRL